MPCPGSDPRTRVWTVICSVQSAGCQRRFNTTNKHLTEADDVVICTYAQRCEITHVSHMVELTATTWTLEQTPGCVALLASVGMGNWSTTTSVQHAGLIQVMQTNTTKEAYPESSMLSGLKPAGERCLACTRRPCNHSNHFALPLGTTFRRFPLGGDCGES